MANIMSQVDLKQKPSYNGFDLSYKHATSAKAGEILPIFVKEVMPGDKFTIKPQHFTRTQPVETAAYTRIREYVDFYYVPYNLLWDKFNTFYTKMDKNSQVASSIISQQLVNSKSPYFTSSQVATYLKKLNDFPMHKNNFHGFSRSKLTAKLLMGLGYGDFRRFATGDSSAPDWSPAEMLNTVLNPFPLLAYQKRVYVNTEELLHLGLIILSTRLCNFCPFLDKFGLSECNN